MFQNNADEPFTEDLTLGQYNSLSDKEKARLWEWLIAAVPAFRIYSMQKMMTIQRWYLNHSKRIFPVPEDFTVVFGICRTLCIKKKQVGISIYLQFLFQFTKIWVID